MGCSVRETVVQWMWAELGLGQGHRTARLTLTPTWTHLEFASGWVVLPPQGWSSPGLTHQDVLTPRPVLFPHLPAASHHPGCIHMAC